ncbi:uncharacterized protein LOC126885901 [Diabrotica virgifera virgifera]|uniref:Uncharacterized protein n=1 Tax=Diabrotica virgifera virgifera TaxID=50390 RepID=A0ABM5KER3_DIAVI|nr:uncharacterized protein LOC126885901 [Diabrotica virgifera virgifera]
MKITIFLLLFLCIFVMYEGAFHHIPKRGQHFPQYQVTNKNGELTNLRSNIVGLSPVFNPCKKCHKLAYGKCRRIFSSQCPRDTDDHVTSKNHTAETKLLK